MNTTPVQTVPQTASSVPPRPVVASAARHEHRARDFGVGYGSSSGYASERRYVGNQAVPRFRCA
ncbi:hypothetical protein [Luteimonas sp. R10]|uniref:hypothetical protein n=1 Tax=Luteimonas sp. R10 TaxID=3108176 RepID=UPI00308E4B96|nr:hypothetical protein U3649_03895 [Luteimonas sp. R10]